MMTSQYGAWSMSRPAQLFKPVIDRTQVLLMGGIQFSTVFVRVVICMRLSILVYFIVFVLLKYRASD